MRTGLATAAVVAGILSAASAHAQPASRQSLESFFADPARVASLQRGVAVMKARAPSDPTSWFFQAAVHGVSDEAIAEALDRDPNIVNVEQGRFWNQCPHSGQPAADFLLWHRAYLFYFERILQEAAGDPSLRVPYWDYTDPAQRTFPPLFADRDPDPATGAPRNPLFDPGRELAFAFGLYELSDRAVSTTAAFNELDFFGATEDRGFAGGVGDTNPGTMGRIEALPHGAIHVAVGGIIDTTAGQMSSVATAAFDPIFWVHHANIDRLWREWDCLPDRRWGASPGDAWLDAAPWAFHDTGGVTASETRRAILAANGAMDVRYDTFDPACAPLSDTPPPPAPPFDPETIGETTRTEVGRAEEALELSADVPAVRRIMLAAPTELGADSLRSAIESAPEARTRRIFLDLTGIAYDVVPSVGYDVYVNLPEGAAPDPDGRHWVGTLGLFGVSHHAGHGGGTHHFDISELAAARDFRSDALDVAVVPFDLLEPPPGRERLLRSGGLEIGMIAISVVESPAR